MPPTSANNINASDRPRVLVADDDVIMRRVMWHLLRDEFDVTLAEDGLKACEKVEQSSDFDVVSLDLEMPGLSGIETLRKIKQLDPTIEVLIVTANANLDSAKKALKLGAYDYIDKPFGNEAFRAAIHSGVRRRRKALASEKAEEKLAFVKAQLMQSEKLAAIGQLMAGIAHEVNNPLAVIIGLSEMLLLDEYSPEKSRDYTEKINQSARLCQNIFQKLLTFSRKHESKREYTHVRSILEDTLALKQHDFKISDIDVVRQFKEDIPGTVADVYGLQQVFLNMINNAHQAMETRDAPRTLTVALDYDGEFINISFQDTGPGVPQENLQKIFEPLFTTKEVGQGTGLGLSICYEIIQEHGGDIFVASEPDQGACFVIKLPVCSFSELPEEPGQ